MTTNTPVDIGSLIYSRPDLHSGRPCLAGAGMMVRTIAVRHMEGMSAEEILQDYPHLDMARIHAALSFYFANRELIEADLEEDRRLGLELAAKYPHGWTRETDRETDT
ncbi:MAG: DUF433 domain-containing protein [Chloroflexi bacterium]|nr:DUF433 domain-containing protein [Chloroflexota bacterium]